MAKTELRIKAIKLRKSGLSYSEILKQIPVSKSTLSLWLRSVGLAKKQKQRITEKKLAAAARGGKVKRMQKLSRVEKIYEEASMELGEISKREFGLIGITLYWAEGAKEKDYAPGSGISFTNTDPRMIRFFLKWLKTAAFVEEKDITLSIYIHDTKKNDLPLIVEFWSQCTGFPKESLSRIYFKKSKSHTNRRNIGRLYFGTLNIKVKASSRLNRKISGWIQEICRQWGVV